MKNTIVIIIEMLMIFALFGCSGSGNKETKDQLQTQTQEQATTTPAATYTVGGTISGLSDTIVLQNNGGNDLSLTADGTFAFAKRLEFYIRYAVTIKTQPTKQNCTVTGGNYGQGNGFIINNEKDTSIVVTCFNYFHAYVATGSRLAVWNINDNIVGTPISFSNGPRGVAITPDSNFVYVTNYQVGSISKIQTSDNKLVRTFYANHPNIGEIAITPDGKYVYVANSNDHKVSVIRTSNNSILYYPGVGGHPYGVAITPDGNSVYVTNYDDGTISVIKTSAPHVVDHVINIGSYPMGIAISNR